MPNFVASEPETRVPGDCLRQPIEIGSTAVFNRMMKLAVGTIKAIDNSWDWSDEKSAWAFTGTVFLALPDGRTSKCHNLNCLVVIKRANGENIY